MDKDLKCHICDGNKFSLNEGFYYCDECGTQLKEVLDLNLEEDYVEDLSTFNKKVIKKDKTENKFNVTSWEVLNYILRGLVEELLGLGAKEELKETVLQLWAALLRAKKIAFFNKRQSELPKLGLRFCRNDAKVIYNHKVRKEKKKRERRKEASSEKRELRKQKQLLELSEYEELSKSSISMSTFSNSMSLNSSLTANTNKAVRLEFLPYARKRFKKMVGSKHLAKHEVDTNLALTCHDLKVKKSEISCFEFSQEIRNITLYTILYIALNMIEDDIQLSDLRRYILEGRLTLIHIQKFFPENIVEDCMKICASINYRYLMNVHMFSEERMLLNTQYVCTQLSIPDLKLPNIARLCQRFITDLALPKDLMKFVERVINIYKPEMRWTGQYPPSYECRAMAYIIFVLKLLFGFDDSMEHEISESTKKVNATISEANLFVFDDWMRYLEMRKVILAQAYMPFSLTFNTEGDSHRRYELIKEEFTQEDTPYFRKPQVENLNSIIKSFLSKFHDDEPEKFDFTLPSLTPNATYFQTILNTTKKLIIPDFMHKNPSDSSIEAFINPKNLKKLVKENWFKLKVEEVEMRDHVQVQRFNNYRNLFNKKFYTDVRARTVDYDIALETWEEATRQRLQNENLVFGTKEVNDAFMPRTMKIRMKQKIRMRKESIQRSHVEVKQENLFDGFSEDEEEMDEEEENFDSLVFKMSKMEFFSVLGTLKKMTQPQFDAVYKKLPLTLKWLVTYCAEILDTGWEAVYFELLTIEANFLHILEPMDSVTNMVIFKDRCDFILNGFRNGW
ncbi:hypothetical protein ACFFRR_011007 [Megaselia abdita]